ncbi:MAG: hypothetical protein C5B47_06730 [Verrucomicrobia bacterium]|nr:MAG: hypothetical protein C5B47_06730 [Verrucomicrobiota bacterium]
MSLPLTDTCAGNDSDGKVWGIEGTNLLIILFGLLLSLGFIVLVWMKSERVSPVPLLLSMGPLILASSYVLLCRQGKPKGFDTDLMETLVVGKGWMPDTHHRKNTYPKR